MVVRQAQSSSSRHDVAARFLSLNADRTGCSQPNKMTTPRGVDGLPSLCAPTPAGTVTHTNGDAFIFYRGEAREPLLSNPVCQAKQEALTEQTFSVAYPSPSAFHLRQAFLEARDRLTYRLGSNLAFIQNCYNEEIATLRQLRYEGYPWLACRKTKGPIGSTAEDWDGEEEEEWQLHMRSFDPPLELPIQKGRVLVREIMVEHALDYTWLDEVLGNPTLRHQYLHYEANAAGQSSRLQPSPSTNAASGGTFTATTSSDKTHHCGSTTENPFVTQLHQMECELIRSMRRRHQRERQLLYHHVAGSTVAKDIISDLFWYFYLEFYAVAEVDARYDRYRLEVLKTISVREEVGEHQAGHVSTSASKPLSSTMTASGPIGASQSYSQSLPSRRSPAPKGVISHGDGMPWEADCGTADRNNSSRVLAMQGSQNANRPQTMTHHGIKDVTRGGQRKQSPLPSMHHKRTKRKGQQRRTNSHCWKPVSSLLTHEHIEEMLTVQRMRQELWAELLLDRGAGWVMTNAEKDRIEERISRHRKTKRHSERSGRLVPGGDNEQPPQASCAAAPSALIGSGRPFSRECRPSCFRNETHFAPQSSTVGEEQWVNSGASADFPSFRPSRESTSDVKQLFCHSDGRGSSHGPQHLLTAAEAKTLRSAGTAAQNVWFSMTQALKPGNKECSARPLSSSGLRPLTSARPATMSCLPDTRIRLGTRPISQSEIRTSTGNRLGRSPSRPTEVGRALVPPADEADKGCKWGREGDPEAANACTQCPLSSGAASALWKEEENGRNTVDSDIWPTEAQRQSRDVALPSYLEPEPYILGEIDLRVALDLILQAEHYERSAEGKCADSRPTPPTRVSVDSMSPDSKEAGGIPGSGPVSPSDFSYRGQVTADEFDKLLGDVPSHDDAVARAQFLAQRSSDLVRCEQRIIFTRLARNFASLFGALQMGLPLDELEGDEEEEEGNVSEGSSRGADSETSGIMGTSASTHSRSSSDNVTMAVADDVLGIDGSAQKALRSGNTTAACMSRRARPSNVSLFFSKVPDIWARIVAQALYQTVPYARDLLTTEALRFIKRKITYWVQGVEQSGIEMWEAQGALCEVPYPSVEEEFPSGSVTPSETAPLMVQTAGSLRPLHTEPNQRRTKRLGSQETTLEVGEVTPTSAPQVRRIKRGVTVGNASKPLHAHKVEVPPLRSESQGVTQVNGRAPIVPSCLKITSRQAHDSLRSKRTQGGVRTNSSLIDVQDDTSGTRVYHAARLELQDDFGRLKRGESPSRILSRGLLHVRSSVAGGKGERTGVRSSVGKAAMIAAEPTVVCKVQSHSVSLKRSAHGSLGRSPTRFTMSRLGRNHRGQQAGHHIEQLLESRSIRRHRYNPTDKGSRSWYAMQARDGQRMNKLGFSSTITGNGKQGYACDESISLSSTAYTSDHRRGPPCMTYQQGQYFDLAGISPILRWHLHCENQMPVSVERRHPLRPQQYGAHVVTLDEQKRIRPFSVSPAARALPSPARAVDRRAHMNSKTSVMRWS